MTKPTNIDTATSISLSIDKLWTESGKRGAFELNPDVVSGWVEMALGALDVLVTAKRGKHSDDKALKQTIEEHLDHAHEHAYNAFDACDGDNHDDRGGGAVDDDGHHHMHHATARVALALTRKSIVEREKEARPKMTFEVDSTDAFEALDRIQSAAYAAAVKMYERDGNTDAATKLRLQREGLADANGNSIPCVPKAEKKPVVVIGMDGGDCYRATAPVEKKCDNSCVPNGTVLIGGTRYRPTHGLSKVGKGTGYWEGVAVGVVGCDAAAPSRTVTCQWKPERAVDGKGGGFWWPGMNGAEAGAINTNVGGVWNPSCNTDGCVTITSHEQCAKLFGDGHSLISSRTWNDSSFWWDIDRNTGTISVKSHETSGDDGGTFVSTEPPTINGKPFAPAIHQTRIWTAVDSVRAGDVVAVEYTTNWQLMPGDLSRVTFCGVPFPDVRFDCKGCAWAKWSGGPGYSQRCDACKTNGLARPRYEAKR